MSKNAKMKQRAKLVVGALAILTGFIIGWYASIHHAAVLLSLTGVAAFSAMHLDYTNLVWKCKVRWHMNLNNDLSPFLNLSVVLALSITLIVFGHLALAYACALTSSGALLAKEAWDWINSETV